MRNNDSYTTLRENKHLKRPIYPLAGKFYKPDCSTFIHPLHFFFFSTWDYKVVGLCQESSRCSAKGVRAMCVRKKAQIRDSGVKRVGAGGRGETGLEAERPEMERETQERWETDLLQDSCSLSGACSQHICSLFFFSH